MLIDLTAREVVVLLRLLRNERKTILNNRQQVKESFHAELRRRAFELQATEVDMLMEKLCPANAS